MYYYSVQHRNLRLICGWLVHVVADQTSFKVLFERGEGITVHGVRRWSHQGMPLAGKVTVGQASRHAS